MIEPETNFESSIVSHPEWQDGLAWGMPRPGHPEGAVGNHIRDVLANIEQLDAPPDTRSQLRLIALVHDTFKYAVNRSQPRVGENHHGLLARRFLERIGVNDQAVLLVTQLHDEAFNAYSRTDYARAKALILTLGYNLDLYLRFFAADNTIPGKSPDSFKWFVSLCFQVGVFPPKPEHWKDLTHTHD